MPAKNMLIPLAAAALLLSAAGCVPSDAEIESEMSASRREAYQEWKSQRDRGETREVKVEGPLSLEDAVKLALQYNKPLQSILQEREAARGERISQYAVILPSVTLSSGLTRIERGRGNTDIDRYSTGLRVSQPIFEGERIPAVLRTARLTTALTDETIRGQVQTLIQDVAGNYYDVLLAQHLVETHREALTSAEAQYRMVSEKKKQETATDYDVLRAQVDVATYRARMISEQNAVDSNRVTMLKNMGVSQDSEITFSDNLEFLPMRPVFERAVELASGNRPDLRQAELDARIADEAVRIARSAWWPSVAGSFDQGWADGWGTYDGGGRRDSFGRSPWQAGLSASYTLGIDNAGDLVTAKARARQSRIDILDRQETTLKEIRQQMNSLTNAEEMVKALEVNQDAAREALRLVLVGYQAGVKTEVDVTDARKALTEVQGQYYTSLTDHTKARLNLQVAMGVLGPSRITDTAILPPRVPVANIEEFAATDYVPPAPLPMPTADNLQPEAFRRDAGGPVSEALPGSADGSGNRPAAAPGTGREQRQAASSSPSVAPGRRSAPVAGAAAPTPVVDKAKAPAAAGTPAAPVLSAVEMPPPPADTRAPAAGTIRPAPGGTLSAPVAMIPPEVVMATAAAPEPRKEQPLFKIKVRDGNR